MQRKKYNRNPVNNQIVTYLQSDQTRYYDNQRHGKVHALGFD